jgi:uncharacterized membrane protein YkvA (DUF1232 family)
VIIINVADIKIKAKQLKMQTLAVYYASRDPRLPIQIKILAIIITAYALSPIDLIPDFIAVIGLLDDIIIIPLCLAFIIKVTPPDIMAAATLKAQQAERRPVSYSAAVAFVTIWFVAIYVFGSWIYRITSSLL